MPELKNCYIPKTLKEALQIRSEVHAVPLAGGTDLMVKYRTGAGSEPHFPFPVMLIGGLGELRFIRADAAGNAWIGPLETSRELAQSALVPWHTRQAACRMGAISLRNQATIGGNIGNSSPKGDLPATLILLDAEVELSSVRGKRRMLVDEFIQGAKKNMLADDELITAVVIPPHDFSYLWYRKIGTRRANAISKLNLSAAMTVKGDLIVDFRASSGAAGPKVERSRAVENTVIGKKLSDYPAWLPGFLADYDKVISPHAMPQYRRRVTRNMLEHFVTECAKHPEDAVIDGSQR